MTPNAAILPVVALAGALVVSACAIPLGGTGATGGPVAQQSASTPTTTVADCRAHADRVFSRQNPDHVYRTDAYETDTRDAPFASTGMRGVISEPLPQQFARDDTMDECLRASGYGAPAPMSRNLHGEMPAGH
jgi:hypothetical protein